MDRSSGSKLPEGTHRDQGKKSPQASSDQLTILRALHNRFQSQEQPLVPQESQKTSASDSQGNDTQKPQVRVPENNMSIYPITDGIEDIKAALIEKGYDPDEAHKRVIKELPKDQWENYQSELRDRFSQQNTSSQADIPSSSEDSSGSEEIPLALLIQEKILNKNKKRAYPQSTSSEHKIGSSSDSDSDYQSDPPIKNQRNKGKKRDANPIRETLAQNLNRRLQDKTDKNLKDLMNDKFKEEQPGQDIAAWRKVKTQEEYSAMRNRLRNVVLKEHFGTSYSIEERNYNKQQREQQGFQAPETLAQNLNRRLQDKTGKNLKDLMNDKFKEEQPDQDITKWNKGRPKEEYYTTRNRLRDAVLKEHFGTSYSEEKKNYNEQQREQQGFQAPETLAQNLNKRLQDKTGKNLKDLINDKFKEEQPNQDIAIWRKGKTAKEYSTMYNRLQNAVLKEHFGTSYDKEWRNYKKQRTK